MFNFKCILMALLGYLLGSVSLAIIVTSGWGKDIRKEGSGNSGATNMTRVFGWSAGVLTLVSDMAKAYVAMWIGSRLCGDWGIMAAGMGSMLGHCYPVFHKFKGGKGISVGAMIGLMIDWRVFVIIIAAFLIGALLTKKVAFGSVCASISITISSVILGVSLPKLLVAAFGMCLAVYRHKANIKRMIEGTEPDFKAKKER